MIGGIALDELRGEIVGRACAVAGFAKIFGVRNGQAEIDDLDDAVGCNHGVARADVTVHELLLVNVFHPFG